MSDIQQTTCAITRENVEALLVEAEMHGMLPEGQAFVREMLAEIIRLRNQVGEICEAIAWAANEKDTEILRLQAKLNGDEHG